MTTYLQNTVLYSVCVYMYIYIYMCVCVCVCVLLPYEEGNFQALTQTPDR